MAINKKLINFATKANFDTRLANLEIDNKSIIFINDTGQIWTHGKFYNCGVWGTNTTGYVPLTIGGLTYDLSKNGHKHSTLFTPDGSSQVITVLNTSGNVGIGTTNPGAKLDITTSGVDGLLMNQDTVTAANSARLFFKNQNSTFVIMASQSNMNFNYGATIGSTSGTNAMSINTSGNVGIGTTNPIYKLDVDGAGRFSDGILNSNAYFEKVLVGPNFPNSVANQAVDIRLGNFSFWGYIEVEINSTYANQNSTGKLTKIFAIGTNPANNIYTNESRVSDALGTISDNIAIGELSWDATNSTYKIPISHIVSSGNTYTIKVRMFSHGDSAKALLDNISVSSIYTLTALPKNYVNYNSNVGIGTATPGAYKLNVNGDTYLGGNTTILGNLTINGTTTTVNSTTVTIDDPILTLGGDTAPTVDDNKDRGIEFRYHNGTSAKTGFFGRDDSTGYFSYIPDATNTSEIFSGILGDIAATNFRGALIGNATSATHSTYVSNGTLPTPANSTVGAYKDALVQYFSNNPNSGIGANVVIGESVIAQWGNDSATYYPSSVYSVIKIGGGYAGTTYGQWLLSDYASRQIGVVGRAGNTWTALKWLAFTDDNVASATKLQTARTLTIGSTGKSFDGTANVSWSLSEIGAAASNQTMYIGTTAVAINRTSAALTLAGVNIGGNAATATNLTNFVSTSSSSPVSCNDVTTNGLYYYTSTGPATSLGFATNDAALYVQSYSTSLVGQIAQDYRTGRLAVRGKNAGTWTSWWNILDSNNYSSYNPSINGGHATSSTSIYAPTSQLSVQSSTNSYLIGASSTTNLNTVYSNASVYMNGTTLYATTFSGSGASLTALNGSNISTGTVANARIASALTSKTYNGLNITSTTGTLTLAALKTLTVNNTITLSAASDSKTLNINNGGTLGSAAFTDSTAYAPQATISATLPATIGWYRIATSAVNINRCSSRFEVDWAASGYHGQAIFNAGIMYGQDQTLNTIHYSHFGTALSKIRIVYHTTYTGNYAYVEVYNSVAIALVVNVQLFSSLGWTLVTPSTVGSIPTGYSNQELILYDGIATEGQLVSMVAQGTAPLIVNSTTTVANLCASSANKVNNSLSLKFDTGTTEGTSLYTFDGSSAKTIDIIAGSNVSISKAAGIITISSTDTNTVYTHPTTSGNKHIPTGGSAGQILRWNSDGTAEWGADNNNTYGAATTTNLGLTKLFSDTVQSIAATAVSATASRTYGVQVNSSGQLVVNVPWTDNNTTYSNFVGATASVAGTAGLVPAPTTANYSSNCYLKSNGTWTQVNYSHLTGTIPTWNQNTTGNAASATYASRVTVALDSSTSTSYYPLFVSATSGNLAPKTDALFSYNPGTDRLTVYDISTAKVSLTGGLTITNANFEGASVSSWTQYDSSGDGEHGGYQKFPSGMIIQWGTFLPSSSTSNLTYPIAFPNAVASITLTPKSSVMEYYIPYQYSNYCTVYSSSLVNYYFVAIGF